MTSREKVVALRRLMKGEGLDAYIIPSADPHLDEYVPDCWRRLRWLSGFTGSAGTVVVTQREAGLWTDSRYFLQAGAQLDAEVFQLQRSGVEGTPTISAYLTKQLRKGRACGVDAQLFSQREAERMEKALDEKGIRLRFVRRNLVDLLWADRPAAPRGSLVTHPIRFAGEGVEAKLERLRQEMADASVDAHVVTTLDSVAWLFNIRGDDVRFIPLAVAYAVVTREQATLFVDPAKLSAPVRRILSPLADLQPYDGIAAALARLGKSRARVLLDRDWTTRWVTERLRGAHLIWGPSPVARAKAVKNSVQIAGVRAVHVRDGVAHVRFLHWLEGALMRKRWTESALADRLDALRAEQPNFRGISFETIVGFGANGAIVHYEPRPGKGATIRKRGILLLDSGGQYLDGTTDITRTVTLGKPTPRERELFTLVLKGHVNLARTSFPKGTTGHQLEALAHQALWLAGLNYMHGTGHGVGQYLGVHEGPVGFSLRGTVALEAGHLISLEPGYYEEGQYGFRTENVVLVVPDEERSRPDQPWFKLDPVTLCPIDRKLIAQSLLSAEEIAWLNAYHERVRRALEPRLKPAVRKWLREATRPL